MRQSQGPSEGRGAGSCARGALLDHAIWNNAGSTCLFVACAVSQSSVQVVAAEGGGSFMPGSENIQPRRVNPQH